ncbi:MAG: lipopolysaccharide biosynthesis protein [Burkholderiales bacterium]|nr:MAG: lipopolysaccharide biosynthesis protein [Burkholderiales bacterium]
MSLRLDLVVSYGSQLFVAAVGVAMLPPCRDLLGSEAYGLVAVMAVMQVCFQLLEFGLGPLLSREAARFRGGAVDAATLHAMLRTLEGVFLAIALVGAGAIIAAAPAIAGGWLRVETLSLDTVADAIVLIALATALRWGSTLYRGVVVGFESLVWLGGWESLIAVLRFVAVLPFLAFVSRDPLHFFAWQLAVSALEFAGFALRVRGLMPTPSATRPSRWSLAPLRGHQAFVFGVAFAGIVWIGVTQVDKVLLMRLLPLDEFGQYSMTVMLASVITMLVAPLSEVIVPRLVRLAAAGDRAGFHALYRHGTRGLCALVAPPVAVMTLFAEPVLAAYSGDAGLAAAGAPVLALYALGNGCLAVASFQYFLQYAHGDLRLHVRGNLLFSVTLVPAMVVGAQAFGMVGAGWAWFATNLAVLLAWVPVVHRRHAPGLHRGWLLEDVARPMAVAFAAAAAIHALLPMPHARPVLAAALLATLLAVAAATAAGGGVRGLLRLALARPGAAAAEQA